MDLEDVCPTPHLGSSQRNLLREVHAVAAGLEVGVGAETSSVVGGFHCRFRLFASASSTDRWLGPHRKSASKPAMYSRFTS